MGKFQWMNEGVIAMRRTLTKEGKREVGKEVQCSGCMCVCYVLYRTFPCLT